MVEAFVVWPRCSFHRSYPYRYLPPSAGSYCATPFRSSTRCTRTRHHRGIRVFPSSSRATSAPSRVLSRKIPSLPFAVHPPIIPNTENAVQRYYCSGSLGLLLLSRDFRLRPCTRTEPGVPCNWHPFENALTQTNLRLICDSVPRRRFRRLWSLFTYIALQTLLLWGNSSIVSGTGDQVDRNSLEASRISVALFLRVQVPKDVYIRWTDISEILLLLSKAKERKFEVYNYSYWTAIDEE